MYDGHVQDPTIEGPKFHKRNGWYYLFAPAGGVRTGWQTVLRSRNVYGPYERKLVMHQGNTNVNGPHQGAWIQTSLGEHWFLHFQDKGAYGRVLHLQPMKWVNDWPVIGSDPDGDGIGEPVTAMNKPKTVAPQLMPSVADSDEFNQTKLGLQWQWEANPSEGWGYPMASGQFRLFSVPRNGSTNSLWLHPAILSQKFPAERFTATVKLNFSARLDDEQAGLLVNGTSYASISLMKKGQDYVLLFIENQQADKGGHEQCDTLARINTSQVYLRVCVDRGAVCRFGYSVDGIQFNYSNRNFTATEGKWVGATLGLYCTRKQTTNDAGYVDLDWFRVEPLVLNATVTQLK